MLGGAKGIAAIPSDLKSAYGVLKGLGERGGVVMGSTPEGAAGVKAINQGLKALTVPEEAVNAASILGKGPNAADLVAELKVGLQTAKPKDILTLSNGSKWRFDGIQKVGDKSETLLEHMEGPVPEVLKGSTRSTTLSTLEGGASGAPAIAADIAAQKALMLTEDTGGATMNLTKGSLAGTPNYSVSIYPERELIVKGELTTKQIESFIEKNKDLLNDPTNSLGIWTNDKGQKVIDVVVTMSDKEAALKLGMQHKQDAIWDLLNMKEIPVPKE
jgi:hypothetical protein